MAVTMSGCSVKNKPEKQLVSQAEFFAHVNSVEEMRRALNMNTEFLNALIKSDPKAKSVLDTLIAEKQKQVPAVQQPGEKQKGQ